MRLLDLPLGTSLIDAFHQAASWTIGTGEPVRFRFTDVYVTVSPVHPTDPPQPKVVQLVATECNLLVVCDDGSMWAKGRGRHGGGWEEQLVPRRTKP